MLYMPIMSAVDIRA